MNSIFRCPHCAAECRTQAANIACVACDRTFESRDGIYDFLTSEQLPLHRDFLDQYRRIRQAEKRGGAEAAWYVGLPEVAGDHPFKKEWDQRQGSMEWLRTLLQERFPDRRLDGVDAGAGNCWLTRWLAEWHHRATALDLDDDPRDGLGAGSHFLASLPVRFQRVRADFARLPFADAAFDLVIFNGAFHYALQQGELLDEALRVVRPGGAVVVIDSPVYTAAEDGEKMMAERAERGRAGYLTIMGLNDLANARGLKLEIFTPGLGFGGWLRKQLSEIRRGREIAMMDRIVFNKASVG